MILPAELPLAPGAASFDEGIGIVPPSPFHHPLKQSDSTIYALETGFTNYYSAPLDIEEKTLYSLYWGIGWHHKAHTFRATILSFSAFDIYQELFPSLGYAYQFSPTFRVGGTVAMVRKRADTLSQWTAEISIGSRWESDVLSGDIIGEIGELPLGFEQQPRLKLTGSIQTVENLLGAQGLAVSYDTFGEKVSFSLALDFPLFSWWHLNFSLRTAPLFLHFGTQFTLKRVAIGALLSRHAQLGWSQTISIIYRN